MGYMHTHMKLLAIQLPYNDANEANLLVIDYTGFPPQAISLFFINYSSRAKKK